jgi:hypothetical protein
MGGIGALPFASASVNRSWKRSSACENSLGISQTLFESPCAICGSTWRYW